MTKEEFEAVWEKAYAAGKADAWNSTRWSYTPTWDTTPVPTWSPTTDGGNITVSDNCKDNTIHCTYRGEDNKARKVVID